MLQLYTRIAAVALAVAGAAAMSSILKTVHGVGFLYLSTAAILACAGFWYGDAAVVRSVVRGMGVLYLLSGLVLATVFLAVGFAFEGREFLQSLINAAFGGVNLLLAGTLSSEIRPEEGAGSGQQDTSDRG